jgi:hypothetical protein
MKPMRAALLSLVLCASPAAAQAWSPDAGEGRYRNPIVFADYSDPDVIRVGGDFYMTSSSFGSFPGLPILHSRDLVHWTLVNHALPRHPDPAFDAPQHGNGVWAPSRPPVRRRVDRRTSTSSASSHRPSVDEDISHTESTESAE